MYGDVNKEGMQNIIFKISFDILRISGLYSKMFQKYTNSKSAHEIRIGLEFKFMS